MEQLLVAENWLFKNEEQNLGVAFFETFFQLEKNYNLDSLNKQIHYICSNAG